MSLIAHAKRELERHIPEDPDLIMCYIEVVSAFEAKANERLDPDILATLFKRHHLGEITNDPDEWIKVATSMWQNRRDVRVFSDDGGHTYYFLSDDEDEDISRQTSSPKKGTS